MSSASKKHEPSHRKLEKAREDGKVAKSPVFTQLFQLVGVFVGTAASIHLFWSTNEMLLHYKGFWDSQDLFEWVGFWSTTVSKSVLVSLGGGLIGALMGEAVQVGLRISFKPLALKGDRLNPVQGATKFGKGLKSIWLVLLKFFGAAAVAFFIISVHVRDIPTWWLLPPAELAGRSLSMFSMFGYSVIGFWFALGLMERAYKKFEFLKEQRMTDEEMKNERKDSEGDPHMRSLRKSLQRQLAYTEVAARVKKARVVIVKKAS